jgi:large repetitive protein
MNYPNPITTARALTDGGVPALVNPVALLYQGMHVLLATLDGQPTTQIYYAVRNGEAVPGAADEWSPWSVVDLASPSSSNGANSADVNPMLRVAGIDLITVPVPLLPLSGPQAISASFQAVTDQRCISILRVSSQNTVLIDRFVLAAVPEAPSKQPQDTGEQTSTMQLQRVVEARYQRSGRRDVPAGPDDSLGTTDMLGNYFYEPTIELSALPAPPTAGNLTVVLGPTATGETMWHFFVTTSNGVTYASYPSDSRGLPALFPPGPSFVIQPGLSLGTDDVLALTPSGAVAAAVYQEQESMITTAGTTTLRRGQRLMVAMVVSGMGSASSLAVIDFQIQPDGTIPTLQGTTPCALLDGTYANGIFTAAANVASYAITDAAIQVIGTATVYASLLGQPQPVSTPVLFDSADANVHCYFVGPNTGGPQGPLQSISYSSLVTRASVPLTWTAGSASGSVLFTGHRSGTNLSSLWVVIADPSGEQVPTNPGVTADLCGIVIAYGAQSSIPEESWAGLPRNIELMAAIMNGYASDDPDDPNVQSGAVPYYDFHGIVRQARLPIADASNNTGALTLLTHRLDVALSSITVAAGSDDDHVTMTITYAAGGTTANVTQTWTDLSISVADAVAALAGTGSENFYPYTPASTDTVIYGFDCSGGTILFFASSASIASIQVTAAENDDQLLCNITVTTASSSYQLTNVPRQQNDFVAALRNDASIAGLFLYISPDPVWDGQVADNAVSGPMSLKDASILFDLLPATIADGNLQTGTVDAAILQHHSTGGLLTAAEAGSVSLFQIPPPGTIAWISNTTGTGVPQDSPFAGQNGAWTVSPAPTVAAFTPSKAGIGYLSVPVDVPSAFALVPQGAWTVEAWCQPQAQPVPFTGSMLFSYNGPQPSAPGAIQATYFLGLQTRCALSVAQPQGQSPSNFTVQVNPSAPPPPTSTPFLMAGGNFTIEIWCKIPSFSSGSGDVGALFTVYDGQTSAPILLFGFTGGETNSSGVPVLLGRDGNGNLITTSCEGTVPVDTWTHVAVAVTGPSVAGGTSEVQFYINGQQAGSAPAALSNATSGTVSVTIGAPSQQFSNLSLATQWGVFNELRVWLTARTQAALQSTLYVTLDPGSPSLLAYWAMIPTGTGDDFNNHLWDYGPYQFTAFAAPQDDQSISVSPDSIFLTVYAGLGGAPVSQANLPAIGGAWNHVAASFAPTGALALTPPQAKSTKKTYGICRKPSGLTPSTAATFEAWVQIPQLPASKEVVFAQWGPDGVLSGNPYQSNQAYLFGIAPGGLPFATITVIASVEGGGAALYSQFTITASNALVVGKPHHLAVTWEQSCDTNGAYSWDATFYVDGVAQPVTGTAANGAAAPSSTSITFTINDSVTGNDGTEVPAASKIVASTAPFTVGLCSLPTPQAPAVATELQMPFSGLVSGLRVWSNAIDAQTVQYAMTQLQRYDDADGVISSWWFGEQKGQSASDSTSDNVLLLSQGDLWATLASLSTISVYVNGVPANAATSGTPTFSALYDASQPQLSMGAYANHAGYGLGTDYYCGDLAEVRFWACERTAVEIASTMFRPLLGNEPNLRGYWPLNGNSNDLSEGGNNAVTVGAVGYATSTAPVGSDVPTVQQVYNGTSTALEQSAMGTPAVFEFGVLDQGRSGLMGAEMFRGMVWSELLPGLVNFTNYGIGSLDLVYLGQVQSQPTLVGYVEGAPPVPSENLSRPLYSSVIGYNAYMDTSSVTLTQTEAETFTFTQDDELEFSLSEDFKLGRQFMFQTQFFFLEKAVDVKAKVGFQAKDDFKFKKLAQQKYVSSWTRATTDRVALRGAWEPEQKDPAAYVSPAIGRRYQPWNLGYAVVESFSADMYSMQLTGTNTMMGRVVLPNLELGKQRNVIPFQMNSYYVKNGTLDGKVGFANDPDYPNADLLRGSYFKPVDAALRASAIAAEEASLQAWFDSFNAINEGRTHGNLGDTKSAQYVALSAKRDAVPRRGIVNTYVWSADGGLHKEEEQFLSSHETTYTGTLTGTASGSLQGSFEAAAGVGAYGGFDLSSSVAIRRSLGKAQNASYAVALAADVVADPFLAAYDAKTQTYSSTPQPGKVDSYRFQTFYLQPAKQNAFDFLGQVVDPVWLHYSSDPGAIALREVQISGNKPWRILHRVNYVSRIPPSFDTNPAQQVSPALPPNVDIQDNLLLADFIQDTVGLSTPSFTALGAAVSQVLDPTNTTSGVASQVEWWSAFASSTDPAVTPIVASIASSMMTYLSSAYANAQLPVVAAPAIDLYVFRRGRMPKLRPRMQVPARTPLSAAPPEHARTRRPAPPRPEAQRKTEERPQISSARKSRRVPEGGSNGTQTQEPST